MRLWLLIALAASRAAAEPCIAKTGCKATAPLPACPLGLVTHALAEVTTRGWPFLGKQIAVRGPLHHTAVACTVKKCAPGSCCNSCSAYLDLATRDDVQQLNGARDAILFDDFASAFRCAGDDSAICCPTQPDGTEVIAQGKLERGGEAKDSHSWRLAGTTLCRPVSGP